MPTRVFPTLLASLTLSGACRDALVPLPGDGPGGSPPSYPRYIALSTGSSVGLPPALGVGGLLPSIPPGMVIASLSATDSTLVLTGAQRGFAQWKPALAIYPAVYVAVLGQDGSGPLIVGHRGVPSAAPENTLAGIAAACRLGIPAVEVDVRFTADGVPVLLHDRTVDRTSNGTGNVDELTLARLLGLDFGVWFGPKFAGQRLPTLPQALAVMAACGFDWVQLDLKTTMPLVVDSGLALIGRALAETGLLDRTQVAGDLPTLARVHAVIPGVHTLTFGGVITESSASAILQAGVEALALYFEHYLPSSAQLARLQASGVSIGVWGAPTVLDLNTLMPPPQFVTSDWPWVFVR